MEDKQKATFLRKIKLGQVGRILIILTSPLLVLSFLSFCILLNPFAFVFNTGFVVQNNTDETIYFTPIGITQAKKEFAIVPQKAWPLIAIHSLNQSNLRLTPGQTKRIQYDDDDVAFSHIYIRSEDGKEKQMAVSYSEGIEIGNLDSLPDADPDVIKAANKAFPGHFLPVILLWWAVTILPFLWIPLFIYLRRQKRKEMQEIPEDSS